MNKYINIIIGAGPSGLQLGYFFQKASINYIIIEKGEKAATFFSTFPHTETLISINKKYTGNTNKDFNLRHDWNSLLNEEELLFTNYSDEYYPNSKDLVKYLNDFASSNKLNIIYNSTVKQVDKKNKYYQLEV
jgi:protoporphyrinogen oxidase